MTLSIDSDTLGEQLAAALAARDHLDRVVTWLEQGVELFAAAAPPPEIPSAPEPVIEDPPPGAGGDPPVAGGRSRARRSHPAIRSEAARACRRP